MKFLGRHRTRSHERHVAHEDVPQLRQLVDAVSAKDLSQTPLAFPGMAILVDPGPQVVAGVAIRSDVKKSPEPIESKLSSPAVLTVSRCKRQADRASRES